VRRTFYLQLQVQIAAHSVHDDRNLRAEHCLVADQHYISAQFLAVVAQISWQFGSGDFFLAFQQYLYRIGQRATGRHIGFQGCQDGEKLAFVVGSAAGVKVITYDLGFEGRRPPILQRVDRLDIEMTINEQCRIGYTLLLGVDERVTGRFDELNML